MAKEAEESEAIIQQTLRITDIAEEPLEYLAPIGGYVEMPLVSLEEAVEPLVSILPDIQSYVYTAKQRCEKPADGLSQDESASIMLYTMEWQPLDECLYIILNATLRSPDRQQKFKPWRLYMRLFLNALFRLQPLHGEVYRGIKLDMSERYIKGQTFVWWGFSTCTTDIEVLQSDLFLGETGIRTIFNIKCKTAKDISKHSSHPSEHELLLLPATQFTVLSSVTENDLCTIHLEETYPLRPLLQLVPIIYQINNTSSTSK